MTSASQESEIHALMICVAVPHEFIQQAQYPLKIYPETDLPKIKKQFHPNHDP